MCPENDEFVIKRRNKSSNVCVSEELQELQLRYVALQQEIDELIKIFGDLHDGLWKVQNEMNEYEVQANKYQCSNNKNITWAPEKNRRLNFLTEYRVHALEIIKEKRPVEGITRKQEELKRLEEVIKTCKAALTKATENSNTNGTAPTSQITCKI